MRTKLFLVLLVAGVVLMGPSEAFSRYRGVFEETFFERQRGARSGAMGGGSVGMAGDVASSFYNPAALVEDPGLTFCFSFSDNYYTLDDADYTLLGASYPVSRYEVIGVSRYHFDYGEETRVSGPGGRRTVRPAFLTYTFTVATKRWAGIDLGANVALLEHNIDNRDRYASWLDVGVLKVFRSRNRSGLRHSVAIGSSLSNLTYSKVKIVEGEEEDLPVIFRLGSSYSASWYSRTWLSGFRTLRLLLHAEYQDVVNSDLRDAFKIGGEISFIEMLMLRLGYYSEQIDDYGLPDVNESELSEVTYGFGVAVPVYRFTNGRVPLGLRLDVIRLDQPERETSPPDWDEFTTYTVCASWYL